jgi:chorismate synthase
MSSCFGNYLRVSIFGQSHSAAIGVVIDGLPAGFRLDEAALEAFLSRRAPGQSALSTSRREADRVEFLSGLVDGVLCGAPLCAILRNTDVRPGDYSQFSELPRPGHADFTAQARYHGAQDPTGGGHFSGRLTAPLCVAGGICLQLLAAGGIQVGAHIAELGGIRDRLFDPCGELPEEFPAEGAFPVLEAAAGKEMQDAILAAKQDGDSVGGVIECAVLGLPAGLGAPMFDGLENRISTAVFAVPAVRGIEFGNGFACAGLRGSENNDAFVCRDGQVRTETNNHGGILGGLSSGMPVIFRAAVKPTPSIAKPQRTVSLVTGKEETLTIRGRHDPCIVPRAVPCIEAAAALAVCDLWLPENLNLFNKRRREEP